jgi:2-polyprenyl-3-methyl-5-hydroxy-6-metoxy-1,4-benzoquinol methylase
VTEWKLFDGDVAPFTDDDFYRDREAAHHMEQAGHRDRLIRCLDFAIHAKEKLECNTFSDLGCGDGGLVEAGAQKGLKIWGYDMQPKNIEYGLAHRIADIRLTNFETDSTIQYGDCSILSEVLEHVSDPHGLVRDLPSRVIVASSPFGETDESHYEFHNWAWDDKGYAALIEQGGYEIYRHEHAWLSQVILGVRQ